MNDTEVRERLAELGVVETEAEDEVLLVQDFADGRYAVITDSEGRAPETFAEELYWTLYADDGEFLWTVTIQDGAALADLLAAGAGDEDLITRMSDLRAKNTEEFLNRQ